VVPVLIYPENYLTGLESWVAKADEAELNLVILSSPYSTESLHALANNLLMAETRERLHIEGELTAGLPVSIPLPESAGFEAGEEEDWDEGEEIDSWTLESAEETSYYTAMPAEMPGIVDLASPVPEARLPFDEPETWTAPASPMPSAPAPEPEDETFEDLDYADAEEGAIPVTDEAPLVVDERPVSDVTFPVSFEDEEFRFDVNLDQKSEADWLQTTASESLSAGILEGMSGFENMAEEPEPVFLSPEEEGDEASTELDALFEEPIPAVEEEEEPVFESQAAVEDAEKIPPIITKAADESLANPGGYKAGDRVRHETYGVGLVNKVIPMEENVILNITFENVGKRLLDPALCRLTRESL
jgi:hypothetical protein